ncbi:MULTISPECIES: hypothetical protein [unclassified Bradyrhizobium]|uniref:hypothetical protein n=1 Tax=unclassified Bradyrhizobium TaxID=2631580 RepID=UPI001FF79F74|nr:MULTISPECIES: hypothetical protein [unclassified Bradyrhizobium]MCK1710263.1 hypothetical protein [Bradyrhizobium sp. 143]MCK1731995.1 hypothetical protein [Bradyrhizobium sp. 142]
MSYPNCTVWKTLTPVQKGATMQQLIRQAHAARSRAISKVIVGWVRYIGRQRPSLCDRRGDPVRDRP